MAADLITWATAEYAKAQAAARREGVHLRSVRRREARRAAAMESGAHCSAIARMCALGEVLTRLGADIPPRSELVVEDSTR